MIYLFGSQATKTAGPRSDFDFGVVFETNLSAEERFKKRLQYLGDLGKILRTDKIDVVDLNQAPTHLAYSVIAPREIIFVRNEGKRIDFEQRTLSFYFDRLYYLRRHTLNSLATIARG